MQAAVTPYNAGHATPVHFSFEPCGSGDIETPRSEAAVSAVAEARVW